MALLSLIAFTSNAIAHIVNLTGLVRITLNDIWPLHLLALVMFLVMCFSLCARNFVVSQNLIRQSKGETGELDTYAQRIQKELQGKSAWQRMFGRTPLWVGVVTLLLSLYALGSFAVAGFQQRVEIRERYGQPWLYDDGWIRAATDADLKQLENDEIRFSTAGFAMLAFVPWAYFTYRSPLNRKPGITS